MSRPEAATNGADKKSLQAPYLLFMLFASITALTVFGVEVVAKPTDEIGAILHVADFVLCGLFLGDFLYSLYKAENKLQYFVTWGWLDLISSIPAIDALRWGRAARVVRILRVLRGIRSARLLLQLLAERRIQSGALAASMLVLLLLTFSSVTILHVERSAGDEANIRTAEDAMWWSVVTMTTVGYGDKYPVSTEGRLLASLLMVVGVGIFGSLSGLMAASFLAPAEARQDDDVVSLRTEIRDLRESVEQLRKVVESDR